MYPSENDEDIYFTQFKVKNREMYKSKLLIKKRKEDIFIEKEKVNKDASAET